MKDKETGEYSVFFQAKDTVVMENAFKKLMDKFENKKEDRESTLEKLNKLIEKVKDAVSKEKVKNKHKEQSL